MPNQRDQSAPRRENSALPSDVPDVAEVHVVRGAQCAEDAAPDVAFEVPHGATRAIHFDRLAALIKSPLPPDLRDFFFVNTDVGAPEMALRTAQRLVLADPTKSAIVVRCLIPRTLTDTNRVVDPTTRPAASAAGAMTPGVPSYIRNEDDLQLLIGRHAAYHSVVTRALAATCGPRTDGRTGRAVMLHTYAPRSVDVPVDDRIVEHLRNAYRPEVLPTWPLRSPVDLITNAPDGTLLADEQLVALVTRKFVAGGFGVVANGAYSLHESTSAHRYATQYAGQTLCVEFRRDLLVPEFTPFSEMNVEPAKVDRMAALLADALIARSAA